MAMDRNDELHSTRTTLSQDHDVMVNPSPTSTVYERERVYDREGGGSNFLAFLIGGLVIAIGLLAFLFYDGGATNDVSTTSSTTPRIESPASPSAGASGTAAPASPSRPASPTSPANPQ